MEELAGQDIRIILSLKEGRCFGAVKGSPGDRLLVAATLNGAIIDTHDVPFEDDPVFDAELIWESNKKALRSLRTAGQAIKVQCILKGDSKLRQERVGHFVVSLREAHLVPTGKTVQELGESWWHWQKLSGAKSPCPEIRCSLRLEASSQQEESPRKVKGINPNLVTRLHSDKGVIQIGSDETATEFFTLVVYMGQAVNLDLLLAGNYTPNDPRESEQLSFQYRIMDYAINTKHMPLNEIHRPIALNEKMGISLCSCLKNLQQYFAVSSKLIVKLFIGQQEIGIGEFPLQGLVPTTNMDFYRSLQTDNFITIEHPCYLKGFLTKEVPRSPKGLQPYIFIRVKLKCEEPKHRNLGQGEGQTKEAGKPRDLHSLAPVTPVEQQYSVPKADIKDVESMFEDILPKVAKEGELSENNEQQTGTRIPRSYRPGSGDVEQNMNTQQLMREIKAAPTGQAHMLSVSTSHFRMPATYVSKGCQSEFLLHDSSTQAPEGSNQLFHTYTLNIAVQVVVFWKLPIERRCFFQFHHPKAEIIRNSHPEITVKQANQTISLQDLKCKFRFVSTSSEINRLLLSCPPKISICDMSGCRIAFASLNIGPLLAEEARQCNSSAQLIDPRTSESVGTIKALLTLEDEGPEQFGRAMPQRGSSDQDLGPAILDDRIAYRIVEELEDWKERQEILFKSELKKKEATHLAALTEEWRQRRIELERNLNRNVEQCRMLAQSLNDTTDELRLKTCKNAERERELNKYKEMIESKHKLKIMEVKEAARRIEDDLNLKIATLEREKEEQDNRVKKLEKENVILKETIISQEHDLDEMTKSSLTKDQTASLFQEVKSMEEKLESALKSKSFFKEQWTRAVRELHRFKTESHQAIQIQIKHNKEDVQNLGLQHLLTEGPQKEEDAISPPVSLQTLPSALDFSVSKAKSSSTSSSSVDNKNEDTDTRLKTLVQQRDSLMGTDYSLADPTISKLNQEIRTLLIHSNAIT